MHSTMFNANSDAVVPSKSEALRFLTALDAGGRFTFQTFADNAHHKGKGLVCLGHGTLEQFWCELVELNNSGAGIFVTVNKTDLKGRKTENVVAVRALFVDLDGAPLDPVTTCSTPPHIVVMSSPGRWHAYWLVSGVPLDQFAPLQKALADRFSGDRSVHDLPRVLRLPGFVHRKGAPFLSILQDADDQRPRYTLAQMRAAFPPALEPERKPERSPAPELSGTGTDRRRGEAWAQAALTASADELANAGEGTRHKTLLDKAVRMGTMIARGWIDRDEVYRALFAAAEDNGQIRQYGVRHFNDTFNDGIAHGILSPHPDLPDSDPPGLANPCPTPQETWPSLDDAAFHGLAGEVVHTFRPHTEADPVAVLIQFLILFGNVVGPSAHFRVEADIHHANLFGVLAGQSSKGRKGTAAGRVRSVMSGADPSWVKNRLRSGLSSGEGLINEVRDPVQKWDPKAGTFEVVDPGVADRRLMITEPEFANALAVMERHGNTLSPVIRNVWDGVTLSTLTKNNQLLATNPHISIVGHITDTELRAGITRVDACNGFANRFLFLCVRRSQLLPFGGSITDAEIAALADKIKAVVEVAKRIGRVNFTPRARGAWAAVYPELSKEQPGLLGAVTARSEAQAVRLALIYALLDGGSDIDVPHLKAALAVWHYAEASAAHIFGKALGDPVADEILRALQQAGAKGMTRTAIRDLFGRHQSGDRIGAALALLLTKGRARMDQAESGGRRAETWFATKG